VFPLARSKKISLLPDGRVRLGAVQVDAETPVLQGTTAQIKGVGFHRRQRDPPGRCGQGSQPDARSARRAARSSRQSGGLGALLNSAPELIDRIQRLTERLTELLSTATRTRSPTSSRTSKRHRRPRQRAPDLADAIATRGSPRAQAGITPRSVGMLADSTNRLVNEQGKPAAEDLAQGDRRGPEVGRNLDAMVADARPGVQNFSKNHSPEVQPSGPRPSGLSTSLRAFRTPRGRGRWRCLGPEKLPDYKPGKTNEPNVARTAPLRWPSRGACMGGLLAGARLPPWLLT
jgi:phospholipid/cholesterol/gamma-HCH transport system substrate-binding protein